MKIHRILLLAALCLIFACEESLPEPDLSKYPKLMEMEYFSGRKDSIQFLYDEQGRLSELIFDEVEGKNMGRRFIYDGNGRLIRQIENSAFFAAIALGMIEKTFEYQYDGQGRIIKEVLLEDNRLWRTYGGGEEWEENQRFDEPKDVLGFTYHPDGRLHTFQVFNEFNHLPEEIRISYLESDTSLTAEYFREDTQNPQQLQNYLTLYLLEVDERKNPFYELSQKLKIPLTIYLSFEAKLDLVHSLTSQNPMVYLKALKLTPFQEYNSSFTYSYTTQDLPERISRPFQSGSDPIVYRFEY
ncbi:MAG: hypothetical protein AAGD28_26035 [Bacteroidota bacterium]